MTDMPVTVLNRLKLAEDEPLTLLMPVRAHPEYLPDDDYSRVVDRFLGRPPDLICLLREFGDQRELDLAPSVPVHQFAINMQARYCGSPHDQDLGDLSRLIVNFSSLREGKGANIVIYLPGAGVCQHLAVRRLVRHWQRPVWDSPVRLWQVNAIGGQVFVVPLPKPREG